MTFIIPLKKLRNLVIHCYDDNTTRIRVIVDNDYGPTTVGTGDLTWDRIVELKEYEGVSVAMLQ